MIVSTMQVENTAVLWENEELGAKFKVWPLSEAPAPVDDALRARAAQYRAQLIETAVEQVGRGWSFQCCLSYRV